MNILIQLCSGSKGIHAGCQGTRGSGISEGIIPLVLGSGCLGVMFLYFFDSSRGEKGKI